MGPPELGWLRGSQLGLEGRLEEKLKMLKALKKRESRLPDVKGQGQGG